MSRPYRRLLCAWAVACASAALAAQPGPTPDQIREGERVFKDVFGKEYDRLTKGKATAADRVGLGKRLWEAARGAKDDPGLVRVFGDKALTLVLADPVGYPIALEIRTARVTDGKDRPEQLAAVAAVLERMARAEADAGKRTTLAVEAVELYREASELEADAGQPTESAGYAGRAKMAAQMLLPPAQAAAVARDITGAAAEAEAVRRYTAEVAKLRDAVKAKPDDPKGNQLLALALLRGGREGDAQKHLAAAPPGKLTALADHLTRTPVDHAKVGNLYRELAEDHPADRAVFLGLARRQYETALGLDPKHLDGTRLRLLVKELPPLRRPGQRPGGDTGAVLDENPAVAEALRKGPGGAKIEWAARDGLAGGGCLKVTPGTPGVLDGRSFSDEALCKFPVDGSAEYRYVGFAYRQVGGTKAGFMMTSVAGAVGPILTVGPPDSSLKGQSVGDKPAEEWTVVTRDLFADNANAPTTVTGLAVWTDGELYLDAVYLAKNLHQRDLRRAYAALGVGPGKPKP